MKGVLAIADGIRFITVVNDNVKPLCDRQRQADLKDESILFHKTCKE